MNLKHKNRMTTKWLLIKRDKLKQENWNTTTVRWSNEMTS